MLEWYLSQKAVKHILGNPQWGLKMRIAYNKATPSSYEIPLWKRFFQEITIEIFRGNMIMIHFFSECSPCNTTCKCWFVTRWLSNCGSAVWFCILAFWLEQNCPLSLSRCPGWFGVLENPLVAFLLRVALHQGKGVASHGEASETRGRRFQSWKNVWFSHLLPLLCSSILASSS